MTEPVGYEPGEVAIATLAAKLENGIIPHPALKNAQRELRMHQLRSLSHGDKEAQPGHLLLVTGLPGAGKTTLLEQHKRRFPDLRDEDGLRITAVLAEMPSPCTKKGIVEAIFRSLGHEPPRDWNSSDIINSIANLVQKHHVLMIMLDEADRMLGGETDAVAKFLVSLLNTVKAQFVLAGDVEIGALNKGYGLARRTQTTIELKPYRWDTEEGQTAFRALLKVFEVRLALPKPIGLDIFDLAKRIYVGTGGLPGIVSKLLVQAVQIANHTDREIDRKLLGEAWINLQHEKQKEQEIDFDRDVEENPLRPLPSIRPADNPFLCAAARVTEIWRLQRTVLEDETKDKRRQRVVRRARKPMP